MNKLTIFVRVILENIHIDYTCSTFYLSFMAKQLHIMSADIYWEFGRNIL